MTLPRRQLAPPDSVIALPLEDRPRLFVTIDTEEEFDWSAPFSRDSTSVSAMRHVGRAQQIFDRYGISPTYVVDYCVAHQQEGYEPLLPIAVENRCTIGAHLHPWITPPFRETVSRRNSFACNLDVALEYAKIETLRDEVERAFGVRPEVYKAGRYGIGAETIESLRTLGFKVDMSVNPTMDFSVMDGPSFAGFDPYPFLSQAATSALLFLPCTVGFLGILGQSLGGYVHRAASHRTLSPLRGVGVLSRLGLVNKVMLSPEGNTLAEMMALTRRLAGDGLRTFSLTFHSPSLDPGQTPYVRTAADLSAFLESIDRFCEFFFHDMNGEPARPLDFRAGLAEPSR